MNCTIHTEREATGTCTYCGKFFCHECLVDVNGRNYCREHIGTAVKEQTATTAAAQPNIVINNSNANSNTNTNINAGFGVSPKSRMVTALLCLFLGVLGGHRFYAGKIGTGVLYLFTGGLFGVGIVVDLILILIGSFRDGQGLAIKI